MQRTFVRLSLAQSFRSWIPWKKEDAKSLEKRKGSSEESFKMSEGTKGGCRSSSSGSRGVPTPETVVLDRIQHYYQQAPEWRSSSTFDRTAPLDYLEAVIRARRSFRSYDTSRPLPADLLKRVIEATIRAPTGFNLQSWTMIVIQSPERRAALAKAALSQRHVLDAPATIVFAGDTEPERNAPSALEMGLETKTISPNYAPGYLRNVYYFLHGGPLRTMACLKSVLSSSYSARTGTPLLSVPVNMTGYAWKQTMIPLTTFLYLATAAGLETCVLEGIDQEAVGRVCGLPKRFTVPAIVTVGYPLVPKDLESNPDSTEAKSLRPSAPLSPRLSFNHFVHWEKY